MPAERSPRLEPEGRPPAEQTAAEVGAMVAAQVRAAIGAAEQSAEEARRQALQRASANRETVKATAARSIDRIDAVEAKVRDLLQTLRDEVTRTVTELDRADVVDDIQPARSAEGPAWQEPAAPRDEQTVPPDPPAPPPAAPAGSPGASRRGLLRRRRLPECAVCGRAAIPGEEALDGWRLTGKLKLCPQCQDDGWRLAAGARAPYRRRDGT